MGFFLVLEVFGQKLKVIEVICMSKGDVNVDTRQSIC